MMKIYKVLSVNTAKNGQRQTAKLEEHGLLNHFITGKKVAKMEEHAESNGHQSACQAEASSVTATLRGSVVQQLQQIQDNDRLKTRVTIKCLLRCTHFLAHQHTYCPYY